MNRYFLLYACICMFLLTGCKNKQTKSMPYTRKPAQSKLKAVNRDQPQLFSAEQAIQSGDIVAARSYVDSISPESLSAQQRNKLNLLYAQIHLSNGESEKALNKFSITQAYKLNQTDQITFYQSLAFAHSLNGNLLKAVQTRIKLNPVLKTDQQRSENNVVILKTLSLLPTETLIYKQPPAPDTLGGWMALAKLIKANRVNQNPLEFQNELQQWKLFFPQHPANSSFILSYLANSTHNFALPASIALLLPESGRFAQAAQVIKEGFMEASHHSEPDFQPTIRFYDSSSFHIASLYHQAISEGAELIIGPLSKDNIQELALNTELTIPVLALNHIPNLAVENLFQFGLSPLDEARQVSNMAAMDGNTKAVILTPKTNQGIRVADYLTESWEETGGKLLETQSYQPKTTDFSSPIKKLLNLDESKYRYNRLKKLLSKNIHYIERRRQDIDTILLSASTKNARSLYPQIRFYQAPRVPVYAMPNIYSGQSNSRLDFDLNNITFCDIPWLFPDAYASELNQESLRSLWQHIPRRHLRLLALGIDSFNIISHLEQLATLPYPGATGTLSLNQENRITRQLVCAKFIDGNPVLQYFNDE